MANFVPFKAYILSMLDELVSRHHLTGPFLDVGCGRGDVSVHLAQRGWPGKAIDSSTSAIPIARQALAHYPAVEVSRASLETQPDQRFNTILMLDVLEHIPDDSLALTHAARLQAPTDSIILTVPSNPDREWRWDDKFYGHVRRYRPAELQQLLSGCGYSVLELWDISFPFFWLLRRGFTRLKRPPTLEGTALQRTEGSSGANAWEMGWVSKAISAQWLWRPARAIQSQFRHQREWGCELMALARRN